MSLALCYTANINSNSKNLNVIFLKNMHVTREVYIQSTYKKGFVLNNEQAIILT